MIIINIDKAKDIAHEKRRVARAEEFKPHDEVIMKQIPGNDMAEAETARQAIRVKYETIQADIESAEDVVELKQILDTMSE
jgi:hypothetical protein